MNVVAKVMGGLSCHGFCPTINGTGKVQFSNARQLCNFASASSVASVSDNCLVFPSYMENADDADATDARIRPSKFLELGMASFFSCAR